MIPDAAALPLWVIVIVFGGSAAIVRAAGSRLARYATVFADRTGIGKAFPGLVLLGGVISRRRRRNHWSEPWRRARAAALCSSSPVECNVSPSSCEGRPGDTALLKMLPRGLQVCSIAVLLFGPMVTAQACAIAATPDTTAAKPDGQAAIAAPEMVFQTSVSPLPDEDLAAPCRYEITLTNSSRTVQGVWVIFERSRDMLEYYRDADVRTFARRRDLALLFPFHCRSRSATGGDMNVDPSQGIGRALFAALTQLAQASSHAELESVRLILLGFSGTGSLVGRLAEFAPNRILAVIPTDPGHFDPLGVDTISLSRQALAIPHLILTGSSDAISGTQRPYEYFRRYFDQGAPWTFVVQNNVPHCCIMNAKALILRWLDAVVVQRLTRTTGWYGFIKNQPSGAIDCPDQSAPVRPSWCRSTKDTWGGGNWSVTAATIDRRPNPPIGMTSAGWLPTRAFAKQWVSFVTRPDHPVRLPP